MHELESVESFESIAKTRARPALPLALNLFAIVVLVGLVGCRTAPMIHPDALSYLGSASGTPEQAHAAIVRGARRAGWSTEASDPSAQKVFARFMVRPQVFAVVQIAYTDGRIAFQYANSSRFKCQPIPEGCATIHKSYNTRLLRLRGQIEQALSEPAPRRIAVPQAVSIVRQVIEEQPQNAYLTVDVTDERVNAIREVVRPTYQADAFFDNWGHGPYSHHTSFYSSYYGPYYGYHGPDFGWYPFGGWHTTYVSTHHADVVYFNNIGRIELRDGGRWQVIQIWDRHGKSRIRLLSPDVELAKRFVDAVGVLMQARLDAEDDDLPASGAIGPLSRGKVSRGKVSRGEVSEGKMSAGELSAGELSADELSAP